MANNTQVNQPIHSQNEGLSFINVFGVPKEKIRMLRVCVIVSHSLDIMKSICERLVLHLAQFGT